MGRDRALDRDTHIFLFPRVLVVDDDSHMRNYLDHHLERELFAVEVAEHGREAIEKIDAHESHFDAVVLDLAMPVMDGFEALDQIDELAPDLPIIVLSAHHGEEEKLRALDRGADEYLEKPFSVSVLARRLRWHLDRQDHLEESEFEWQEHLTD